MLKTINLFLIQLIGVNNVHILTVKTRNWILIHLFFKSKSRHVYFFYIIVFMVTHNVEVEMNSSPGICKWPCFQIGKSWISMFYKEEETRKRYTISLYCTFTNATSRVGKRFPIHLFTTSAIGTAQKTLYISHTDAGTSKVWQRMCFVHQHESQRDSW